MSKISTFLKGNFINCQFLMFLMRVMVFILLLWRRKERNLLALSGKQKENKPDRKSSFSTNTVSVIAFGNYYKTEAYRLLFYYLCLLMYSFHFHALFVDENTSLMLSEYSEASLFSDVAPFHLIISVLF